MGSNFTQQGLPPARQLHTHQLFLTDRNPLNVLSTFSTCSHTGCRPTFHYLRRHSLSLLCEQHAGLSHEVDLPSRRSLRPVVTKSLVVPISRLSTVGSRAFPVAGPQTWNDLPEDVTSAESLATFHRLLKTHLFRKAFTDYLLDIN